MRFAVVGILVMVSLAGCTKGGKDSDADGLRDTTERAWPDLIVDYMDRRVRLEGVTSDRGKVDTDGDGLSDFDEFFSKTDPRNSDTDKDGLTDCQELIHTIQAECEDLAFAGDYDGGYGTNPTRADSDPGPVRYLNDGGRFTDETGTLPGGRVDWGDGISDKDEIEGYAIDLGSGRSRTVITSPRDPDTDGDGLEDGEEALQFASDPTVLNTDGDACDDAQDPWPGVAETYDLRLGTFTLKVSKDAEGSDLAFTGQFVDRVFVTEARHVSLGENDISDMSPAAGHPGKCPMNALVPWGEIQLAASDQDPGGTNQNLDFTSLSQAPKTYPEVPILYWNVRTGESSWDPSGETRFSVGPIRLEGVDGVLTLSPVVVFPQGS